MVSLDSLESLDGLLSTHEIAEFDNHLNEGIEKVINSYKQKSSKLISIIQVLSKAVQDLKMEIEELKQRNDELNNENKNLFSFKQIINECVEKGNCNKTSLSRSESGLNLTSNASPLEALGTNIDYLNFKNSKDGGISAIRQQTSNLKTSNKKLTENIEEMIENLDNSINKKIYNEDKLLEQNMLSAKSTLNQLDRPAYFEPRKGDGNYNLYNPHNLGTPSNDSRDGTFKKKNLNIQLTKSSKATHKILNNPPTYSLQDYLSKSTDLNQELDPSRRAKGDDSRMTHNTKEVNEKILTRQRNLLLYMKTNYDFANYSQILKIMSKFNVNIGNKTNKLIHRKSCINQILQILQVVDPDIMMEFSSCFT